VQGPANLVNKLRKKEKKVRALLLSREFVSNKKKKGTPRKNGKE